MTLTYFLVAVFVSFFILYSVARHDFVLLRQNISLKLVFDNAFLALFVGFFLGRFFFAISTNHLEILNPLKFLYLSKFWGVSLYVAAIGIIGVIYFLFRKRKNIMRIFDIYALAFYPLLVLDIALTKVGSQIFQVKISLIILTLALLLWLFKLHKNYSAKDGFLSAAVFSIFSIITFALSIFDNGIFKFPFLITQIISFAVFLISIILMFLIQRGIINKS